MADNHLKSTRFPYLKLSLKVFRRDLKLETLVDTGFDGDITIPADMILNGEPPAGYSRLIIANGETIRAPYFMGTIKIGKFKPIFVQVTVLGDEPLIGRGITDKFKVTFDHGRKIIIEK